MPANAPILQDMLKRLSFLALPLILVGFLAGLGRFLYLRFSAGDVYPAYSSLRTDPVGTKALYESLGRLSPFTAARQFEPLRKISTDSQSTLLFLGLQPGSIWEAQQEFTELARSGARVVLAFDARSSLPHSRESDRINAGPKP